MKKPDLICSQTNHHWVSTKVLEMLEWWKGRSRQWVIKITKQIDCIYAGNIGRGGRGGGGRNNRGEGRSQSQSWNERDSKGKECWNCGGSFPHTEASPFVYRSSPAFWPFGHWRTATSSIDESRIGVSRLEVSVSLSRRILTQKRKCR